MAFFYFKLIFFMRSCCCSENSGWQTVFVFFLGCVRCLTHSLFFWCRSEIVDFFVVVFLCSERAPPTPACRLCLVFHCCSPRPIKGPLIPQLSPRPPPGYCKFYLLPSCADSTIPKTLYLLTIFMNIRVFL